MRALSTWTGVIVALAVCGLPLGVAAQQKGEDLTVRKVEAPKTYEYVEGVNKEAQDAFKRGVLAISKTPPDFVTGKQEFEAAVGRDKAFLEAWFNLGMCYERTRQPEDAIKVYRRCLDANPGNADALASIGKVTLALAKRSHRAGDEAKAAEYETEAKRALDEVIQKEPDNEAANNALALYWLGKGDTKMAEDFVKKVLMLKPTNVVALNTRGLINLMAGKDNIARWVFEEKVLKEDANSTEALTNLGLTYLKLGKTPLAVVSFEKAITVDPDNVEARLDVAAIYLEYLHYQAALDQYEAALKLRPTSVEAMIGSGSCLLGLKRPAEAVARWEQALKTDGSRFILYARIGKAYETLLNDMDKAIAAYDQYVALAKPPANDPIVAKLPVLKQMKEQGGIKMPDEQPKPEEKKDGAQPAPAPAPAPAPVEKPAEKPAADAAATGK